MTQILSLLYIKVKILNHFLSKLRIITDKRSSLLHFEEKRIVIEKKLSNWTDSYYVGICD